MDGNLRRIRERKAFSQAALALDSGVDASTIHRIESGKQRARPSTIRKLAAALDVEPETLTDEQGGLTL